MRYERLKHLEARIKKHFEDEGMNTKESHLLIEVYAHIITELEELEELEEHTD